jgi:hypothetical protein
LAVIAQNATSGQLLMKYDKGDGCIGRRRFGANVITDRGLYEKVQLPKVPIEDGRMAPQKLTMSPEVGALVEQYAMFKLPEFVEQLSNPEFEPSEADRIPSSASK